VFEIIVDGALVYSKKRTGVFPDEAGIIGTILGQ